MKVRDLLSDASKWTQQAYARLPDGTDVDWGHPDAVCWCLASAIRVCFGETVETWAVLEYVREHLNVADQFALAAWNDAPERTFADVKALVDRLDI